MLSLTVPADDAGIDIVSAAARSAVAVQGGNGDAAALVLQLAAADARRRLAGAQGESSLTLTGSVDGAEVLLVLRDHGEPLASPAAALEPLIELGVMTSANVSTADGGNVTELRFARPAYNEALDSSDLEQLSEDVAPSEEPVTIRSLEPGDAAALTRAIYRSYGWSYPHPELYYPERIAAAVSSGKRIGEVAVTADGEVAAHWGAVFITPRVIESGLAITDPRFRRRGLANQLQQRVDERVKSSPAVLRMGEPVLTHTATQEIVLKIGGAIVGAYLSYGVPVAQVGITDGLLAGRRSLCVGVIPLGELEPATIWVPGSYEPFVRSVLDHSGWPREIGAVQRVGDVPESTVLATGNDTFNRRGEIDVQVIGRDLIEAVDGAMTSLRRSGAEVTHVRVPASDPHLASLGEGLVELGLAFSALLPMFTADGDVIVLQSLADPEVDTSSWHYANEYVEGLVTGILGQVTELSSRGAEQRRRAARRASLFAALGG